MLPRLTRLSWAIPVCALLLGGCAPKIGKSCELSTDCSQLGDRLCDTTQPEGYCTIFNCEPDTCPDSACVGFYAQLDPACGTTDDGRTPRFERTFCMAPCSSDSSCRDGYDCVDLSRNDPNDPVQRGAKIVDIVNDVGAKKVCMAAVTLPLSIPPVVPDVCRTGDAGPDWTPYDAGAPDAATPDAGTGGAGGAGGSMGSSSSSGMGGMGSSSGMGGMIADAGNSG
jgi:hypothetical protein